MREEGRRTFPSNTNLCPAVFRTQGMAYRRYPAISLEALSARASTRHSDPRALQQVVEPGVQIDRSILVELYKSSHSSLFPSSSDLTWRYPSSGYGSVSIALVAVGLGRLSSSPKWVGILKKRK